METSFDAGQAAPAESLALQLATAPLSFLEGAVENPALRPELILLILKNRSVTASLIQKLARRNTLLKSYEVKSAIALHPKTPRPIAMLLVRFLWWRDLARVADHALLSPPLRRVAELLLSVRLQELTLGERIALARIAPRAVIAQLRRQSDAAVIRGLLQNPRLAEEDVLAIAGATGARGPVLQALAEDQRFSARPAVMKALVQNRQTPAAAALRLMRGLSTQALKQLAQAPQSSQLVKVAALRLIESRDGGPPFDETAPR